MSNGVNGSARTMHGVEGSTTSRPGSSNGSSSVGNGAGAAANKHLNGALRNREGRKSSSPMMPAFMVSAPGKVIAFGEHAVVHGKAGLHASPIAAWELAPGAQLHRPSLLLSHEKRLLTE